MEPISVKELAVNTREAMRASSVAEYSLWRQYSATLLPIVRWFGKRVHETFSIDMANQYLSSLAERLNRGEISKDYYNYLQRNADRMIDTYLYGSPKCNLPKMGSKYKSNDYYDKLLQEFSESEKFIRIRLEILFG
jgi:hypothetical protein